MNFFLHTVIHLRVYILRLNRAEISLRPRFVSIPENCENQMLKYLCAVKFAVFFKSVRASLFTRLLPYVCILRALNNLTFIWSSLRPVINLAFLRKSADSRLEVNHASTTLIKIRLSMRFLSRLIFLLCLAQALTTLICT